MAWLWVLWFCATFPACIAKGEQRSENGWKVYRNDKFGYELSYPAGLELKAYIDGSSGELKHEGSGNTVAWFEVWPPDECPSQPEGTTGREIGIQRAKDVTQADGHNSSSHCGDPVKIRDVESLSGVKVYELELACVSEFFPGPDDDEPEGEEDEAAADTEPIVTYEGTKWPTYFADISQPWRKRVLMMDPTGNNPLADKDSNSPDFALIRTILAKLKTFPVRKSGICIDNLSEPSMRGVLVH